MFWMIEGFLFLLVLIILVDSNAPIWLGMAIIGFVGVATATIVYVEHVAKRRP